ncbi:type VI secretion system protein TssR domain-containing protein [Marinilabilia salmonicolor]|uniref:type VI secretion system protein TssR domain-containing protein n=1 Tax=Marinilabilia salmonicolor TaxID=989 RepID=UPI00029A2AD9|nr:type VI secretion system protein TssR domain-containing protein [Marinilabilia salmonicolor]
MTRPKDFHIYPEGGFSIVSPGISGAFKGKIKCFFQGINHPGMKRILKAAASTKGSTFCYSFSLFAFLIIMGACAPVNRITRINPYPREYSHNFYGSHQVESKSDKNNDPWIVYSANLSNQTVTRPRKLEKKEDISLLEPFYVIRQRGDFLKLIKYNPEIVRGRRPDRKKAEYMGWIHQSKMILSSSSFTNPHSGFKNKTITAITDTFSLSNASRLIQNDSVLLFANQNLKKPVGKIGFHEVVYVMQKSVDRKKVFITNKPEISVEEIDQITAGWTSVSLIQNLGERLFCRWSKPDSANSMVEYYSGITTYSPVYSRSGLEDSVRIKTGDFHPVIDRSENFILNVNGNPVYYPEYKELERKLHDINVIFVFEAAQNTMEQFPSLVNSVQNLQMLFANDTTEFNYRFGAVMAMKMGNDLMVDSYGLVDDYAGIFNFVSGRLLQLSHYKPINSTNAWSGLRKAVKMAGQDPDATNVIVLIGENGQYYNQSYSSLIFQLGNNNCRLFCNQVYSGGANRYNNFSLQLTEIIEKYAHLVSDKKKDLIVDASQFCSENVFTESQKNYFRLDYPERSMTQGAIVFPEKEKMLSLEMFSSSLDSFITEVKADNQLLIDSYQNAFRDLGNSKNRCDEDFLRSFELTSPDLFKEELSQNFKQVTPFWVYPQEKSFFKKEIDFSLLLNQQEFDDLQNFYDELTRFTVTSNSSAHRVSGAEMFSLPADQGVGTNVTTPSPVYHSNVKVRGHLKELLTRRLLHGKIKSSLAPVVQNLSIGYALEMSTGMPVNWKFLNQFRIRDLMDKNTLSDKTLEEIIGYFEDQKDKYESADFEGFNSLGQSYYWVTQNSLL